MTERANLADKHRHKATDYYHQNKYAEALLEIKQSIEVSRLLPDGRVQVVESYDDAGLYYYLTRSYEASARHQAIAVLLAFRDVQYKQIYPEYLKRLQWAYAKYRPDEDFRTVAKQPLVLLRDKALNLKSDAHIQHKYFIVRHKFNGRRYQRMHLKRFVAESLQP